MAIRAFGVVLRGLPSVLPSARVGCQHLHQQSPARRGEVESPSCRTSTSTCRSLSVDRIGPESVQLRHTRPLRSLSSSPLNCTRWDEGAITSFLTGKFFTLYSSKNF
jgi:hypothetical protein